MFFLRSRHPLQSALAIMLGATMMALTACTQPMSQPKPEYRQNPSPQQAYRLTVTIRDAPGPFAKVIGFTQYDVVNRECLPPPKDNPGGYTSPVPTRSPQFALEQVSESEYTGIVYTDGMIDEDYHGRGVCRWRLQNVQVQLKATEAGSDTLFMADLYGEELLTGQPKTIHYWKGSYPGDPTSSIVDFPDSGQTDRSRMSSSLSDDDVFQITLSARQEAP